ncbi:hypothetical protein [Ligilactobacillus salivarius]|uniref:hypothetical protein n=1 Tax=Ligilactobacillus salivarius TaxID=1624 RepID=UPI0025A35955|nr:hypothetical protein [Ligilactobacillus salivarius]MDM8262609.1 hypothetical protein [Ligilactobacillus salivarius]
MVIHLHKHSNENNATASVASSEDFNDVVHNSTAVLEVFGESRYNKEDGDKY